MKSSFGLTIALCWLWAALAQGHLVLTYPGWRGNTFITNETFPFGMQWTYPCRFPVDKLYDVPRTATCSMYKLGLRMLTCILRRRAWRNAEPNILARQRRCRRRSAWLELGTREGLDIHQPRPGRGAHQLFVADGAHVPFIGPVE